MAYYDEEEEVDPWAPPTNGVAPNSIVLPPAAPPVDPSMLAPSSRPELLRPLPNASYNPSLTLSAPGAPPNMEAGNEALTPEYKPGSMSLYDAHRMSQSTKGIKNRLLRGLDMARVDFLEDPNSPGSPNLKYAAGRAAGDLLMGLISPGSAGRAYEQKVMRPRQEQEKEIARRDQAETWQLQDRENRLKLQGLQIGQQEAAAEAANWVDMGISVGKDGKNYHVIRHSKTGEEKWLLQAPEKPVFQPKDSTRLVPDPSSPSGWRAEGQAPGSTKVHPLMSAEEAAKGAATELGGDVGKAKLIADTRTGRPDDVRQRFNKGELDATFKNDKGETEDAYTHYKNLQTSNPTKFAKLGGQAKIDKALKESEAGIESDVESNWNQRLAQLTPKYKAWQKDMPIPDFGLEHYNEEVPDAMRGIPRGAAPPAAAPAGQPAAGTANPPGYKPKPNPGPKNHQTWQARFLELKQISTDQGWIDNTLKAEGYE
jgi:hypothetical protein